MKSARVGISGWKYARWRGTFYPKGLRQADELAYVSARMATVEINGSFYSLQKPELYRRWHDDTPPGFVFAVKGSRFITHMKKLKGIDVALANFFASGVLCLEDKLGPFLWQLPPNLGFDAGRMKAFFDLVPRDTEAAAHLAKGHDARLDGRAHTRTLEKRRLRHCVEVRHASFADPTFLALLRDEGIGLVVADTAGKFPYLEDVTADFVYARLHGDTELYASGYSPEALRGWARRIRAWQKRGDVYVYFDNDAKVHAPFDALALASMLAPSRAVSPP